MLNEDNLCDALRNVDHFVDYLQANGILVNVVDMPPTVPGFIYISLKGEYHVVINENLSPEAKLKTFLHELKHIIKDLPKIDSIIGLDFQHNTSEVEADIFANNLFAKFKDIIQDEGGYVTIV